MKALKYTLIPFILTALLLAGCAGTSEQTVREEPGRPEKEMAETEEPSVDTSSAAEEEKEPEKIVRTVDLLARENSYFADGSLDEYTVYTYEDESDKLLTRTTYSDDDAVLEKREYEYENGNMIKELVYDASGDLQTYYSYEYDEDGNLLSRETYNADDELQLRSTYEYDGKGNKTAWSVYSGSGALFSTTEYFYTDGNFTRAETYTPAGDLDVVFSNEYNDDGNVVKSTQMEPDESVIEFRTYAYEDGFLVEEVLNRANGSVLRKIRYENNDLGNPVTLHYLNASGDVQERRTREYLRRQFIDTKTE